MSFVYINSEPGLWTVGHYDSGSWNSVSDHASETEAADRVHYLNGGSKPGMTPVAFMGFDPLNIVKGATLPMIPDSWRFGFYRSSDELRFGAQDNGPLVAWDAVKDRMTEVGGVDWGLEIAALHLDKQREAHDHEHAHQEHDTGAWVFDRPEQEEYSNLLDELAEEIRALKGKAPATGTRA